VLVALNNDKDVCFYEIIGEAGAWFLWLDITGFDFQYFGDNMSEFLYLSYASTLKYLFLLKLLLL
jgi:hypothetical protein